MSANTDSFELFDSILADDTANKQTEPKPQPEEADDLTAYYLDLIEEQEAESQTSDDYLDQRDEALMELRLAEASDVETVKSLNSIAAPKLSLDRFAISQDAIEARIKELGDQEYLFEGVVAKSQITVLYAAPNTGKTLFSIASLLKDIHQGRIDGKDCYYINADDGGSGAMRKAMILAQKGVKSIVTGEQGFTPADLSTSMIAMCNSGEAMGKLIIIDTLKKFTDIMNKTQSSEFFTLLRQFTVKGGTVLALAHTNKNKNSNGQSVYAGTGDSMQDTDAAYVMESGIDEESRDVPGGTLHTVTLRKEKKRADNPDFLSFTYISKQGMPYEEMLGRLKTIDYKEVERRAQAERRRQKEKAEDKKLMPEAEMIYKVMLDNRNIALSKTKLVKLITEHTPITRRRAIEILDHFEGKVWKSDRGEESASKVYSLLKHPSEYRHPTDIEDDEHN